jgi:hypothetical protein
VSWMDRRDNPANLNYEAFSAFSTVTNQLEAHAITNLHLKGPHYSGFTGHRPEHARYPNGCFNVLLTIPENFQ